MNKTGLPHSPAISIVLGSYNRHRFLKQTIKSVRNNGIAVPYEIIVIDGGSTDGSMKWLTKQKDIITIVQHNHGMWKGKQIERRSWGYFMNLGFKCAKGKYVCMLSDDCLVVPGAINNGYRLSEEKINRGEKIGAVAFYWRDLPKPGKYFVIRTLGSHIMVNHGLFLKEVLEKINYVDEDSYMFYHADADLSLKIWQKGYKVIDAHDSYIEHFSHANYSIRISNTKQIDEDFDQLLKKWNYLKEDVKKNNKGPIYREYEDPFKTAKKFKKYIIRGQLIAAYKKWINYLKLIAKNIIR